MTKLKIILLITTAAVLAHAALGDCAWAGAGSCLRPLAMGERRADDIVGIIDIDGMQIEVTSMAWEDLQAYASTEFNKCTKDITSSCKLKNKTMHDGTVLVEVVIRHPAIKTSYIKLLLDPSRDHKLVDAKLIESGERYQIENDIKELSIDDTTRQIILSSDEYTYTVITLSTVPEARILRVEQEKIFPFENSAVGIIGLSPDGDRGTWLRTFYPDPQRIFKVALDDKKSDEFYVNFIAAMEGSFNLNWDAYVVMEHGRVLLVLKDRDSGVIHEFPHFYIWNKLSELLSDRAVEELFGNEYLGRRNDIEDESIINFLKQGKKIEIIRRKYWEGYVKLNMTTTGSAFTKRYHRQLLEFSGGYDGIVEIDFHIHPPRGYAEGATFCLLDDLAKGQNDADRLFALRNIVDRDALPSWQDIEYWRNIKERHWIEKSGGRWQALTGIVYHRLMANPQNTDSYISCKGDASVMLYRIPADFQRQAEWLGYMLALTNLIEQGGLLTLEEGRQDGKEILMAFMKLTDRYKIGVQPVGAVQLRLKFELPRHNLNEISESKGVLSNILRPLSAGEK